MQTSKEKVSYCIGLEAGGSLKQQFADIDVQKVLQGFKDALTGAQISMSPQEARSILEALHKQMSLQQKEFVAKLAEENKKRSEAFLEENKRQEGVFCLPSGLQYKVLKEEGSAGPTPTLMDRVSIHYIAKFIDGKSFLSTYEKNQPYTLALQQAIPGWTEALQKMKAGEKWQLYVPSYLAYGEAGFPPHIGPNVALIFELELLAIES